MTSGINDTNIMKETMGKQLQEAREKKFTRKQFVEKLKDHKLAPTINDKKGSINENTLKNWEYGVNPINVEWIPAICDLLACDVGYLYGEYRETTKRKAIACAETGLSETAVDNLVEWSHGLYSIRSTPFNPVEMLSKLCEQPTFQIILSELFIARHLSNPPGYQMNTFYSEIGSRLNVTKRNMLKQLDINDLITLVAPLNELFGSVALESNDAADHYIITACDKLKEIMAVIIESESKQN